MIQAFLKRLKVKILNIYLKLTKSKYRAGLLNNGYPINVVRQRDIVIKK